MKVLEAIWKAIVEFFKRVFTKDFLFSILAPTEEYGRFFYWGMFVYIFFNLFGTKYVSVIMVAITVFIVQTILYASNGRKYSVTDYVFGFIPALLIFLQALFS